MSASPHQFLHRQLVILAFWVVILASIDAAQQLPLKSYTTSDGLTHNTINRIVRD